MPKTNRQEMLDRLKSKVSNMGLGGNYWKPPDGTTVIRILPPVGTMEWFFQEAGRHYDQKVACPSVITDGEEPCPVCEVYEALTNAGESKAADAFRPGRTFYMNIIVRKEQAEGVKVFTPGAMAFQAIFSIMSDPDYGLIYDPYEGTDVKLTKQGSGMQTKYTALPVRKPAPAGTDAELTEWLGEEVDEELILWSGGTAEDLSKKVLEGVLSYEETLEKSGVGAYLNGSAVKEEPDEELPWEEDEEEATPADRIRAKMAQRKGVTKSSGVRRPTSRR